MAKGGINRTISIPQPNVFGRLGSGIGRGISEALPKEIERGRLASGLQQLGEQKGLSPFQQFAALAPYAYDKPQLLQSAADLLRHQGTLQAYNRLRSRNEPINIEQTRQNLPNYLENEFRNRGENPQGKNIPSDIVSPYESGQSQILGKNPLRSETATMRPMTPQEKIDDISQLGENFPYLNYTQLREMSDENEQRRIAQPEAQRAEDERLRRIQERLGDNFRKLLEKKLQKEGSGTYSDITGEMENNLIRSMNRELRERPEVSEDDIVNKWTQKALDLAKAKSKLEGKLGSSIFATPILLNKDEYRRGIKDLADIYRSAGNSEEFYNTLRSYGFSPRGAGSLSYETNKNLEKYISSIPKGKINNPKYNSDNSRKIAIEIEKLITPQDSILSISNKLLFNDAQFDLNSFLNQISEDKEMLSLSERQKRELSEAGHLLPSWPDILVLPLFRGL